MISLEKSTIDNLMELISLINRKIELTNRRIELMEDEIEGLKVEIVRRLK